MSGHDGGAVAPTRDTSIGAIRMVSSGLVFVPNTGLTSGRKPFCKHEFSADSLTMIFYGALRAL
jgi:hypothetical protein